MHEVTHEAQLVAAELVSQSFFSPATCVTSRLTCSLAAQVASLRTKLASGYSEALIGGGLSGRVVGSRGKLDGPLRDRHGMLGRHSQCMLRHCVEAGPSLCEPCEARAGANPASNAYLLAPCHGVGRCVARQ